MNDFKDALQELQKLDNYIEVGWESPCINKVEAGWHVGVKHVYNVDTQTTRIENGVAHVGWVDSPTHVHVTKITLKQALIEAMLKMDEVCS